MKTINQQRLLGRFLRYVQIDTTAGEPGGTYPSSPGQLVLGKLLADELREMGLKDVEHDEHGLVWATVPATIKPAGHEPLPVVAFNAHVDTSPETTGKNVKPHVIRNYAGGDIPLPGDPTKVIRVADNPELTQLVGKTIITTDGTTLLGSDDKAGVAVIMELAHTLVEHPQIPHGPIRILFTCDEEIGHGVDHVDLDKLGATVCYTLDGSGARRDRHGDVFGRPGDRHRPRRQHPSVDRQGADGQCRPRRRGPDRPAAQGGCCRPRRPTAATAFCIRITIEGGVAEVTIKILLRDFDTARPGRKGRAAPQGGQRGRAPKFPGCDDRRRRSPSSIATWPTAWPTSRGRSPSPRRPIAAWSGEPKLTIIRGGTDGSQLTEQGLPTPNLSTGEHNPHSPLEWTCLEEMVQAVEVLVELVQVWAGK